MTADDAGLARFNALDAGAAAEALRSCCAAPGWVASIAEDRPYSSRDAMIAQARAALAALDWSGVRVALDAHPRIGELAAGDSEGASPRSEERIERGAGQRDSAGGDREASWSRAEQSGVDGASAPARTALVEANRAYEERFGHVFLIFATGRTDTEMLAAARSRLGNDEAIEQGIVREELRRIVELRVTKLLDGLADGGTP